MADVYLISDGGTLRRENDTFRFHYADGTVSTFFPHTTESLIVIGSIEITSSALRMLMRHGIAVLFMGHNGRTDGRLISNESRNILIRREQFRRMDDADFVLAVAKSIVEGKIRSQLSFARRIARERKGVNADAACATMSRLLEDLPGAVSPDAVRGYEGAASRAYFSVFGADIMPEWAVFNGRSRNPPRDNVNAVLSFLYTLMGYLVESAILAEGLDTYAGYLHAPDYGRKSLVYDLLEEYRVGMCDTLCAALFNRGEIDAASFRTVDFSEDSDENPLMAASEADANEHELRSVKGVLLDKAGLRTVITAFEKKMETKQYHAAENAPLTIRRIVFEQVRHFRRVISGEEVRYIPFVLR